MEKQLEEAIDECIVHWEEIVIWLKEWYGVNTENPSICDAPSHVKWYSDNCSLCQVFLGDSCGLCPLGKVGEVCGWSLSIFTAFRTQPTIANGEAMLAKLKQLKEAPKRSGAEHLNAEASPPAES